MNLITIICGVLTLVTASKVVADEPGLSFHVGCPSVSNDCVEFSYGDGQIVLGKREPEMTVSQSDISEAEVVSDTYGGNQLQLRLKEGAGEKFSQLTKNNIGKQLVVVANGKALIAPLIQEAITGGEISISEGTGSDNKYLDGLPWLKKMAEAKKDSRESWRQFSTISFICLGALLIGGSIYFAFSKKRRKV